MPDLSAKPEKFAQSVSAWLTTDWGRIASIDTQLACVCFVGKFNHLPKNLKQFRFPSLALEGSEVTQAGVAGLQLDVKVFPSCSSVLFNPSSVIPHQMRMTTYCCQSMDLLSQTHVSQLVSPNSCRPRRNLLLCPYSMLYCSECGLMQHTACL